MTKANDLELLRNPERIGQLPAARQLPDEMLTVPGRLEIAFRRIPAGEFLMGDDKTPLFLEEFWMGKYPVTNAQWAAFVEAAAYHGPLERDPARANHPAVNLSWHDANAFCQWLSAATGQLVRLPGDAEWEKAARGTDGRQYPWGDQAPDTSRCNFNRKAGGTTPVDSYSPRGDSPYGCADMAGNVWEWTADDYDARDKSLRGGSFRNNAEYCRSALANNAEYCRCTFRNRFDPDGRSYYLGFRVCMSPIRCP